MLGDELRKAREKAGMTQQELSLQAGIDRSYISMLEHDKKSPTVEMLFLICETLDTSAARIIARVEKKKTRSK